MSDCGCVFGLSENLRVNKKCKYHELEAERDRLGRRMDYLQSLWKQEAQTVDRLRAALERIANRPEGSAWPGIGCRVIARQALEGTSR